MATLRNSLLLRGISGKVGDIIIKQYRYGVVISKAPDVSKVRPTKAQKVKRKSFKEAVAFARDVIANPKKKAAWKAKTRRGKTVYHTAIAYYLKKQK
jgi:hypothetical protein